MEGNAVRRIDGLRMSFWIAAAIVALLLPISMASNDPGAKRTSDPREFSVGALPLSSAGSAPSNAWPSVLIIVGAAGEPEFGSNFVEQAQLWKTTCDQARVRATQIGLSNSATRTDQEQLKHLLAAESIDSPEALWLVLIGHGTFDGKEARFNLHGPDLSAGQLAEWLHRFRRPVIVINTASASAPFLAKLSARNRVVVTATRSGHEQNFTRFGQFLARTIADPQSDLDHDGQTSLLEAFLSASARVTEFYKTEGRLVTEHALLDDNGDGLGTPADWFRGVRAVKKPREGTSLDGTRAHQVHLVRSPAEKLLAPEIRARRDAIELEIARLREQKADLSEEEYYRKLELLLLELAAIYAAPAPDS